jgi:hypothetical protein
MGGVCSMHDGGLFGNIGNNNNIEMDFKIRLRWRGVDPLAQGRVLWRLL